MKFLYLFVLMCVLGGLGGALGSIVGNAFGRGGLIVGGVVGGILLITAAGYISKGCGWCKPTQRMWAIIGGLLGFGGAVLVTFATLSSPVGPILSTLLIGTGAVLGARIGRSAHDRNLT
jgi:hypothetical protein